MSLTGRKHYELARAALGSYVALHFAMLWPYARELFSSEGILSDANKSPLAFAFPNLLTLCDAPSVVYAALLAGIMGALLFSCGRWPTPSALVAYYVWACLLGRNPLILNPSIPYVGLLLLCCAGVGLGHDGETGFPRRVQTLLWVAMAVGYSYSGLTKLESASWLDGTALLRVLESPLARTGPLHHLALAMPASALRVLSYGTLLMELSFAPLALIARARPLLWGSMVLLHLGLVALVRFADLSVGMLLLHAFTFDLGWLEHAATTRSRTSARALTSAAVPDP